MNITTGDEMHRWATELFRYPRSLTGNGVRQTLAYMQRLIPKLTTVEIPSGTQVMDWVVPDEWNLHRACRRGGLRAFHAGLHYTPDRISRTRSLMSPPTTNAAGASALPTTCASVSAQDDTVRSSMRHSRRAR